MKIEIITIGDEILIGQIVDTNSAWMGTRINEYGWEVVRITTVADKRKDIIDAFDAAFERADVILVTGGTGPTKDDLTKGVLFDYFSGSNLVFHPEIIDNIKGIFASRSINLNPLTETQAWIPDNASYIMNKVGTAPCIYYKKDGKYLFSMAGVPFEMKWIMDNEVLPFLESLYNNGETALHKHILVRGYSESALAEYVSDIESSLPANFKLAYLPHPGVVKLRITARGYDSQSINAKMQKITEFFHERLGKSIFADDDISIAEVVGKKLRELSLSLSCAESCTGGTIARMITTVAGSSDYFKGGVVSYSNEIKHNVLGVSNQNLENYGAVSEAVVTDMVNGVCRICNSDCAVATSGIAGPGGGSEEKPVGTVWIAVKVKETVITKLFQFGKLREYNMQKAANEALLMLLDNI